ELPGYAGVRVSCMIVGYECVTAPLRRGFLRGAKTDSTGRRSGRRGSTGRLHHCAPLRHTTLTQSTVNPRREGRAPRPRHLPGEATLSIPRGRSASVPLTPKQAAFAREYLVDLNATQAAIRAGYSEKTAYSQGQRLLKNAEV